MANADTGPGYKRQIVCLANSHKFSQRCIAGIELKSGVLGEWIRPISSRSGEALSPFESQYQSGDDIKLLDIASFHFKKPRPHACQTENHLVDSEHGPVRVSKYEPANLRPKAITAGPLWVDGSSSSRGINDQIPVVAADRLKSSLMLVAPTTATAIVDRAKPQVRLAFSLDAVRYNLAVTDVRFKARYLQRDSGQYVIAKPLLVCVSLGEPFGDYRYKLAAGIIAVSD